MCTHVVPVTTYSIPADETFPHWPSDSCVDLLLTAPLPSGNGHYGSNHYGNSHYGNIAILSPHPVPVVRIPTSERNVGGVAAGVGVVFVVLIIAVIIILVGVIM